MEKAIATFPDEGEKILLIKRGADTTFYRPAQSSRFSSLLSPDGKTIALPATDIKGAAIAAPESRAAGNRDLMPENGGPAAHRYRFNGG